MLKQERQTYLICAGKGNNGGDGFVIARHLQSGGARVRILLFADPARLSGDALTNYEICKAADIPIETFAADQFEPLDLAAIREHLRRADCVIDALLGTGARGEVREPFATLIPIINESARQIVAIDLPSGLDCDRGEPCGATVKANQTVTFVALKAGFANRESERYTGQVSVLPIGISSKQYAELVASVEAS
ncbi:MAG: NAD(P)H-hydrate epimerase [Planctomycetaceae bacterium]